MKKLMITLLAASLLLTSCQRPDDEDAKVTETTVESTANNEKIGANGRYVYKEFPSTNKSWQLIYDDENYDSKLILTNGEKTFVYGDHRGNEEMSDYTLHFYPYANEDSAQVVISEDEKYAAIIYSGSVLSVSEYKHDRLSLVSLDDGKIIRYIDITDQQILDASLTSYSILDDYKSDGTKKTAYATRLTANFEGDRLSVSAILTTDDNEIKVSAIFIYDIATDSLYNKNEALITEPEIQTITDENGRSFSYFYPNSNYTEELPKGFTSTYFCSQPCFAYDSLSGVYTFADISTATDGKYIRFAVPENVKTNEEALITTSKDYYLYSTDSEDYSIFLTVFGLSELSVETPFDEGFHGYMPEGKNNSDVHENAGTGRPYSPLKSYTESGEIISAKTDKGYKYIIYCHADMPTYAYIKIDEEYFICIRTANAADIESLMSIINSVELMTY